MLLLLEENNLPIISISVLDVNSTSDTELHVATDALNVESTNSGAPNNTDSLSPHSSDESKFIDEPMLADAPNSETDASTNRDIATSIRDKISNMSDTFRKTTEEIGQAVDQGQEMLNATVASSESREKVSINNGNLNPLPPSSFQSDQPSKDMGKTGIKPNTLVNNIRKSLVNASEVMMSTPNQEGTNHEVTSEMAQIKKPKSSKVKIGKGSQLETSPTEDEAESTIPSGGTVNSSVTPDPGAERVSPFHSSSSNSNGSNGSLRNSSGISPTSFNASTDTSLTSSANISTTLRNFTNSQMAQSLVNQTVQDRASLKAKNGGSRLGLVELQRSDWLTLVAMVSMTSRF